MPPAPATKKRKPNDASAVKEQQITFDFSAREEYLTGFHKRKVARAKHAQEEAAKKAREERIRDRAEMRKQRKEDLEKHVAEVNRLVRQANGDLDSAVESDDDDDDDDDHDKEPQDRDDNEADPPRAGHGGVPAPDTDPTIDHEDEYIDEGKYTTVTIESVGISKHGLETKADREAQEQRQRDEEDKRKRVWTREKPRSARPKKKKIKFRYETKAERKAGRVKMGLKKKRLREKREAATAPA